MDFLVNYPKFFICIEFLILMYLICYFLFLSFVIYSAHVVFLIILTFAFAILCFVFFYFSPPLGVYLLIVITTCW